MKYKVLDLVKCSVYEDNEQELVREKNASGWEAWIEGSGKGSQGGTISADWKIQFCEGLV